MTDFDIKRVEEILKEYGSQTVKDMRDFLSFTENLKNSITSEVVDSTLIVTMPYYAIYIEKGRRKGAPMPPSKPIEEWMKIKSIPMSALFPIRRKIAKEGIPAKPFFHFFTDNLNKLYEDVSAALEDDSLRFIYENSLFKNDMTL